MPPEDVQKAADEDKLDYQIDYTNNKLVVSTKYDIAGTDQDPQIKLTIPLTSVLGALAAAKFTPSWADKAIGFVQSILNKVPNSES